LCNRISDFVPVLFDYFMGGSLASFATGMAGNVFYVDCWIVSFVELPLKGVV
jgi:hypothetical protein